MIILLAKCILTIRPFLFQAQYNLYRILFRGTKQNVQRADLVEYFEKFGPIRHLHRDRNPVTRRPNGTSFIDFYYKISAYDATEYPVLRMGASKFRLKKHFVQFWKTNDAFQTIYTLLFLPKHFNVYPNYNIYDKNVSVAILEHNFFSFFCLNDSPQNNPINNNNSA